MTGDNLKPFNSKLDPFASLQNRHTARTQSILDLKTRPRFQSPFLKKSRTNHFFNDQLKPICQLLNKNSSFGLFSQGLKPLTFEWCGECSTIVLLLLANLKFSLLIMIQTFKLVR
jgi:hypothetical protein